jgi:hypothetical protein
MPGAALFTSFVKGAGFLPCGTHRPPGKDRSESVTGEGRIEGQKTRTLEHRKGAPPENSKSLKDWATHPRLAEQGVAFPAKIHNPSGGDGSGVLRFAPLQEKLADYVRLSFESEVMCDQVCDHEDGRA